MLPYCGATVLKDNKSLAALEEARSESSELIVNGRPWREVVGQKSPVTATFQDVESRTSRKERVRGLPWAFGMGRYDCKRVPCASVRSVGYGFLIGDSVQNHTNPHLHQTGS
jgi:hypothetical protein